MEYTIENIVAEFLAAIAEDNSVEATEAAGKAADEKLMTMANGDNDMFVALRTKVAAELVKHFPMEKTEEVVSEVKASEPAEVTEVAEVDAE